MRVTEPRIGITCSSTSETTTTTMRNSSRKRKQPDNPDQSEWEDQWEDLLHKIRQQGGLDLAAADILDLAREVGVTLEELEWYEAGAQSSSNASWEDVASKLNLDPSKDVHLLRFLHRTIEKNCPST